ncbi:MAG: hypothetical protein JXJ04_27005 [Spirochaetales bacterium]|nr:hypothetical protein [Spirochaetales bacterium]
MKYNQILILFLLIFTLAVSCASNKEIVKKVDLLIPGNSLGVIYLHNPEVFFNNIDAFFEKTGGIPFIGDISIRDFISLFIKGKLKADQDWFNFGKSWACAILPGDDNKKDIVIQLYIPLSHPDENYNLVKDSIKTINKGRIDRYGDYMILTSSKESKSHTLPPKSIHTPKLNTFTEGSVTCSLNLLNIYSHFGVDISTIKSMIPSLATSGTLTPGTPEAKMQMDSISTMIDFIMQLEEIYINLEIGSDGFICRVLTSFNEEGTIVKMMKNLTQVKGAKKYLKYISGSSLFSFIEIFNKENSLDFLKNNMSSYTTYNQINQTKLDEIFIHLDNLWNAQGPFSATSFDLEIDLSSLSHYIFKPKEKRISDFDPNVPAIIRSITDNLYFYIENIIDVKDKKTFRQEIENIITLSHSGDAHKPIWEEKGISVSLHYNKDVTRENFTYDEINISLDVDYDNLDLADVDDPQMFVQVLKILEEFIEKIKMQLYFKNDHCYIITGKNSLPLLKEIVKEDAFPGDNLYTSSFFKKFDSQIPDNVSSIGHFSLANLLSYGKNIPEMSLYLTELQQKPGIIWYTQHMKNVTEFAFIWDIEEISFLMDMAGKIVPLLLDNTDNKITMR